jgi:ribonuclease J
MADFKIDWSPVIDKPIELDKIAVYGDAGVLCILSDCLGVTHEGYTKSERAINPPLTICFKCAR